MTEQNRTCPRCKAPYKPDYNYCAICGLTLNPGQKAAARTTADQREIVQEVVNVLAKHNVTYSDAPGFLQEVDQVLDAMAKSNAIHHV